MKSKNKYQIYITILIFCFLLSTICNWGYFFSNIAPRMIGTIASIFYLLAWFLFNFLLRNRLTWIKFILACNSLCFVGLLLALITQKTFISHIPFIYQLINFCNLLLSTLLATYHGLSLLMIWTNYQLLLLLLIQECFCLILLFRCKHLTRF